MYAPSGSGIKLHRFRSETRRPSTGLKEVVTTEQKRVLLLPTYGHLVAFRGSSLLCGSVLSLSSLTLKLSHSPGLSLRLTTNCNKKAQDFLFFFFFFILKTFQY